MMECHALCGTRRQTDVDLRPILLVSAAAHVGYRQIAGFDERLAGSESKSYIGRLAQQGILGTSDTPSEVYSG